VFRGVAGNGHYDARMRSLTRHTDASTAPITGINAEAIRRGSLLMLRYQVGGVTDELLLPATSASVRTDELWRHTCFEAFVRGGDGDGYLELNLSPSTQWAAYRFSGYREGVTTAEVAPAGIAVVATDGILELSASVDLAGAGLALDGTWRVGLSAVIEDRAGGISYWALAHPPGKADFHSPDCFALELPAPERP
jgi:hypothetical protein